MSSRSTLFPVPTQPPPTTTAHPRSRTDLAPYLPDLRQSLEQQRSFRLEQLGALDAELEAAPTHALAQVKRVLHDSAWVALTDIDIALQLMDAGEYGRCQRCAAAIPLERLEVIPAAALCMHCQQRRELSHR